MSEEQVVADWSERPFTSHDRRRDVVNHRVVIETYEDVGVDVRHDVQLVPDDGEPERWSTAEVFEARPHGIDRLVRDERWWAT